MKINVLAPIVAIVCLIIQCAAPGAYALMSREMKTHVHAIKVKLTYIASGVSNE